MPFRNGTRWVLPVLLPPTYLPVVSFFVDVFFSFFSMQFGVWGTGSSININKTNITSKHRRRRSGTRLLAKEHTDSSQSPLAPRLIYHPPCYHPTLGRLSAPPVLTHPTPYITPPPKPTTCISPGVILSGSENVTTEGGEIHRQKTVDHNE